MADAGIAGIYSAFKTINEGTWGINLLLCHIAAPVGTNPAKNCLPYSMVESVAKRPYSMQMKMAGFPSKGSFGRGSVYRACRGLTDAVQMSGRCPVSCCDIIVSVYLCTLFLLWPIKATPAAEY